MCRLFSKDGIAVFPGNSRLGSNLGGQVIRAKQRAAIPSQDGDAVYNKQKAAREGRDCERELGRSPWRHLTCSNGCLRRLALTKSLGTKAPGMGTAGSLPHVPSAVRWRFPDLLFSTEEKWH